MKPERIQIFLVLIPAWILEASQTLSGAASQAISRTYEFANAKEAMEFVKWVAELAARCEHYPEITCAGNDVTVRFNASLDQGGLNERDVRVAVMIDGMA